MPAAKTAAAERHLLPLARKLEFPTSIATPFIKNPHFAVPAISYAATRVVKGEIE
jgi:hypothetical protein